METGHDGADEPPQILSRPVKTQIRKTRRFTESNRIADIHASFFWRAAEVFAALPGRVNALNRKRHTGDPAGRIRPTRTVAAEKSP
jgi:hypothetical protein